MRAEESSLRGDRWALTVSAGTAMKWSSGREVALGLHNAYGRRSNANSQRQIADMHETHRRFPWDFVK